MPTLFVLSGDDVGRSFDFDGPVVLGRIKDVDFTLRSASVSRRHARLEPVDGGWELVDLGSSNGTSLRGRRIERARLSDGDVLRLGDCEVRFRCEAPVVREAPSAASPDSGSWPDSESWGEEIELEDDLESDAPPAPVRQTIRLAERDLAASSAPRVARSRVLQYKRVEQRRGFFAADLSQQPLWARGLVYLLAAGLFAALALGAYRLTLTLRRQAAPPPEVEAL